MTTSHSISAAPESRPLARSVLIGLFVLFCSSGALALIYEVIWQRQFALVFGSAAPATAALLAAYFAGLGAGSLVLGAAAARWRYPLRAYAALEALIGAGALMVTPLLQGLERAYPWLFEHFGASPGVFVFLKILLAFVSIGIPTFCMGGTLPVLSQFVDRGVRRLGISAGFLYVANTLGAALGALSVPFLFLPRLGASGTLRFCVMGNLLVALAAWWLNRFSSRGGIERTERRPKARDTRDPSGVRSLRT
jgi:predicted membrane-bound spermidine synthase